MPPVFSSLDLFSGLGGNAHALKSLAAPALYCDNTTAQATANGLWTKANPHLMRLARHIAMYLARRNIRIDVQYIASAANELADALSRADAKRYEAALRLWWEQRESQPCQRQWHGRVPQKYTLLLQAAQAHRALLIPPTPVVGQ